MFDVTVQAALRNLPATQVAAQLLQGSKPDDENVEPGTQGARAAHASTEAFQPKPAVQGQELRPVTVDDVL